MPFMRGLLTRRRIAMPRMTRVLAGIGSVHQHRQPPGRTGRSSHREVCGLATTSERFGIGAFLPWIEHCLNTFGDFRCFFASNFPVDGMFGSYDELCTLCDQHTAASNSSTTPKPRQAVIWVTTSSDHEPQQQHEYQAGYRQHGFHQRPCLDGLSHREAEVLIYQPETRIIDMGEEQRSGADGEYDQ